MPETLEYILNENGVCINPEIITIVDDKKFRIILKLACYEGKWTYGYTCWQRFGSWHACNGGAGFGEYREVWGTREAAIRDYVAYIKSRLDYSDCKGMNLDYIMKILDGLIPKQLDLFPGEVA